MESLSSVRTILGIVHDILSAVETAKQNKTRCKNVAERVRCIKDILEQATAAAQDDDDDDGATRRLLRRLKKALRRALQEVRRCQRSGSFLVRSVSAIVAGGRVAADPLDAVEAEIDRCVVDLTLAYSLRIVAREKDGENKRNKLGSAESVVPDDKNKMMDTTATTAIGVPVCTATAAVVHEHHRHEMVPPPPSYGYYYGYCCSCRSYHYHYHYHSCCCYYYYNRRNHGCACDNAGVASYASFYHTHQQYSSYHYHPSMFSDADPNSCSMM